MLAILVIAFGSSGGAGGNAAAPSADSQAQGHLTATRATLPEYVIGSAAFVVYGERCKSARKAVSFYRTRTWQHQQARSAELADRTPVVHGKTCRWARFAAKEWQARAKSALRSLERWQKKQRQHPKWIALRLLGYDRAQWSCLMSIVLVENRTMDPTLDYGGGHGNVYEAYGIPQASPGTKMASAGPDWRTNPETQLRWMIDYCRARYGSVCGAAYSRRVYGTY